MQEDYELTLFDRLNSIKDTINKYGEENFYLSFSGGKDSTVLHYLIDMALPNNKIPRVYINTGIEYNSIVNFVKNLQKNDDRIIIVQPSIPIKPTLEKYGYPFKSKEHSHKLMVYRNKGITNYIDRYIKGINYDGSKTTFACPNVLKYQLKPSFEMKISNLCCDKMKKEPSKKWAKENNKTITITGMMKNEGGERTKLTCLTNNGTKFNPLAPISNEFEEWFINKYDIKLCELYYPPFNFKRTGCKGCPYALNLQEELKQLEKYLPNEYKQCEIIWKPVYDEYRRINYRLKKEEQTNIFDFIEE